MSKQALPGLFLGNVKTVDLSILKTVFSTTKYFQCLIDDKLCVKCGVKYEAGMLVYGRPNMMMLCNLLMKYYLIIEVKQTPLNA